MVRISDILKKKIRVTPPLEKTKPEKKTESRKEEPIKAPPSPKISSIQFTKATSQQESQKQKPQDMQIARAMKKLEPDIERSKALYSKAIQLVREVLISAAERKPIDLQSIGDLVREVVDRLVLKDRELFSLFYNNYPTHDYLCYHMVNVMMVSIEIGLGLGYNKSQLNELGLAAILHDIGMIIVRDIDFQPRPLTKEEYNQIKKHPLYGADILSQLKDFPRVIIYAVQEEHERINGTGYPKGIKYGEIGEYALIIGIVDVYEALTHMRVYREKCLPHEAIKEILSSGNSHFDNRIIKVLIGRIGIYPIDSWVELNTNEIGKVVTINDELPLRPTVNLLLDSTGNRITYPRVVDLAKQFNLFVKRPLSDEDVSRLIRKEHIKEKGGE